MILPAEKTAAKHRKINVALAMIAVAVATDANHSFLYKIL